MAKTYLLPSSVLLNKSKKSLEIYFYTPVFLSECMRDKTLISTTHAIELLEDGYDSFHHVLEN